MGRGRSGIRLFEGMSQVNHMLWARGTAPRCMCDALSVRFQGQKHLMQFCLCALYTSNETSRVCSFVCRSGVQDRDVVGVFLCFPSFDLTSVRSCGMRFHFSSVRCAAWVVNERTQRWGPAGHNL